MPNETLKGEAEWFLRDVITPNFKKYNYNQVIMVVINFEQQRQPNTFEYTLHHRINNRIGLSTFYKKYSNDEFREKPEKSA